VLACVLARPEFALSQQTGVQLVGRWLSSDSGAAVATYAGSTVRLKFTHSASLRADLGVVNSRGNQQLFIAVVVDGGKPVRMGFGRGNHTRVVLASGLSDGPHLVTVRKEVEPYFGALRFLNPTLDMAGRWEPLSDERPVIEVISDSGATGICSLGPDSPATPVSIHTSAWAAESVSWVGILESELAAAGHPIDVVNLAMSGSTTESEAADYDYTAPEYSDAHFTHYERAAQPHAAVALLWGGANDHNGGGDVASSVPVVYENLSPFQKGLYDQLTKLFARNPEVRVVLLQYIDSTIPDWTSAYGQVRDLFAGTLREHILLLKIHDPQGQSDACEIDPKGHPNTSMHESWATQIFTWMMSKDVLRQLGLPTSEQWTDE
jgi:hypothetical protein